MGKYVIGAFGAIVLMMISVLIYSYSTASVADSDNQTAMNNAASQAMTEAMNLGDIRVNQKVTIDEEIAKDALIRMYAASSDYSDGARYLNVYQVNSDPAYIAVDSYLEINTPFKPFINRFSTEKRSIEPQITRSRETVIFEAIQTVR